MGDGSWDPIALERWSQRYMRPTWDVPDQLEERVERHVVL